jgi:hypothetical protein
LLFGLRSASEQRITDIMASTMLPQARRACA